MEVETYEQTEMTVEGVEIEEDAINLIKEMGLEGQQELLSPTEEPKRIPYREMTIEEKVVYQALFPVTTPISAYNASIIPLRVLQVAAHAKSLNYYEDIQVWHPKTKTDDPILVGKISYDTFHILARWGDALKSFQELRKEAVKKLKQKVVSYAKNQKDEAERMIKDPEMQVEKKLNGEYVVWH